MTPPPKNRAVRRRSAVSNGSSRFFGDVDARSPVVRRFNDLIDELEAERGGQTAMGSVQRQAVRAYVTLCIEREQIEAKMAAGLAIDAELYGRLCDRMDRQSRRMGPVKVPTRPSLREHSEAMKAKGKP